jgi:predicted nucleotidyltransferase
LQEDSNAGSYALLDTVLPEFAVPLVENAVRQSAFVEESDLDLLLQYALTRELSGDFTSYLDVSEALSNRIRKNLNCCEGFHEFASHLKSRELTHTRISRALLHILLDIKEPPQEIPYARVLGFRKDSAALLSEIKQKSSIPVLTKPADAPKLLSPYGQALFDETTRASKIYERLLCRKSEREFCHEYQKPIILI